MLVELKEEKAQIGNYLYQLVPSIWAFAFYDTTQSFLQAQGRVLAPLIIQFLSVLMHLTLISRTGPAWSKNFADAFSCVAVYGYIVGLEKPLKSWVEWTIKCVKGWGKHMKFLEIIGVSTYAHALFFFWFSLLAWKVKREELICHIYYINIYQVLFMIYIGIQEGSLSKIGFLIKQNQYLIYKKIGLQSIKLCLAAALLFVLLLYVYEEELHSFFMYLYQNTD